MTPAPYCVPCNRHHLPEQPCRDRGLALLGWFLLLVASVLIGLAVGAASVGLW